MGKKLVSKENVWIQYSSKTDTKIWGGVYRSHFRKYKWGEHVTAKPKYPNKVFINVWSIAVGSVSLEILNSINFKIVPLRNRDRAANMLILTPFPFLTRSVLNLGALNASLYGAASPKCLASFEDTREHVHEERRKGTGS